MIKFDMGARAQRKRGPRHQPDDSILLQDFFMTKARLKMTDLKNNS
jgi:hypothetical protein